MKRSRDTQRDTVQRESVRRAQEAGKRQAASSARRANREWSERRPPVTTGTPRNDVSIEISHNVRRILALALVILVVGLIIYALVRNIDLAALLQTNASISAVNNAAVSQTAEPQVNRIGIVSGHRGNDSGTVCQDGYTEAQLNFETAVRVADLLRAHGYTVDILNEFDPRLKGYRGQLLLSIHADSCTYINDLATGFKVARVLDSSIPSQEDNLVACLTSRYEAATGLKFHANTVTFDMTKYHAFYEIDVKTPAAIIETGFMYLDRDILTNHNDRVAQGIYNGIVCFLQGENPDSP